MGARQAQQRPNHHPQPSHRSARRPNAAIRAVVIAVLAVAATLTGLASSSEVSAQTYGPSAPLNLEATVVSATQIDLTWETPAHAGSDPPIRGYRIWVSTSPTSAWTRMVFHTGTTATTYSHTGLSLGDYRRYRVAGLDNDLNQGRDSNIASATIGLLTAPLNLAATPGNEEVTLTWEPPAVAWTRLHPEIPGPPRRERRQLRPLVRHRRGRRNPHPHGHRPDQRHPVHLPGTRRQHRRQRRRRHRGGDALLTARRHHTPQPGGSSRIQRGDPHLGPAAQPPGHHSPEVPGPPRENRWRLRCLDRRDGRR